MAVQIDFERCNGCGKCARSCPYQAIILEDQKAKWMENRCTLCGACLKTCKFDALSGEVPTREAADFSEYRDVWVFVEQHDGEVHRSAYELLGCARTLADDLGQQVVAVMLAAERGPSVDRFVQCGADRCIVVEHPSLGYYQTCTYTHAMAQLVRRHRPGILLMPATHLGRDLAPRVARRLGLGLTADCTRLSIDPDEKILLQTRPAFGGNVMATIVSRYSRPQMATVRPGIMKALDPNRSQSRNTAITTMQPFTGTATTARNHDEGGLEAEMVSPSLPTGRRALSSPVNHYETIDMAECREFTRVLECVMEAKKGPELQSAKVIVAGGRPVCSERGIGLLAEFADAAGAQLACTRVVVEGGFLPPERQVGQTGQTVRPELYFACGISGAIQHKAGMEHARYIVAINKDPDAPIFEIADYAIVGDLFEILPALIRAVREG